MCSSGMKFAEIFVKLEVLKVFSPAFFNFSTRITSKVLKTNVIVDMITKKIETTVNT